MKKFSLIKGEFEFSKNKIKSLEELQSEIFENDRENEVVLEMTSKDEIYDYINNKNIKSYARFTDGFNSKLISGTMYMVEEFEFDSEEEYQECVDNDNFGQNSNGYNIIEFEEDIFQLV